jgi:hypothetical protein
MFGRNAGQVRPHCPCFLPFKLVFSFWSLLLLLLFLLPFLLLFLLLLLLIYVRMPPGSGSDRCGVHRC